MKQRQAAWIAISVLTSACGSGAAPPQNPAPAGLPVVEVVSVVEKPVDVLLSLPGELEAFESVAVFPKISGFVKTIPVDRGSRVRSGQVLVTLDAPEVVAQRAEAQSKLQAAEAQLAAARARAEASASTYDKLKAASATPGVVAGNELTQVQKTVESDRSQAVAAQQNVEAARQALRSVTDMEGYLRVTAPFAGIVTERNVHPGALVGPAGGSTASTPMLRVVNSATLRLMVAVPEGYVAGIVEGTAIPFAVAPYPGQTFTARIARMAHAVDVKTRTMAVELDVSNADGRLAPGAYCQVKWPVRRMAPSLFVPTASVAATTDRTFVIRVRNGRTEWVDVKTGLPSGPLVEVFGGLRAGDQVAARGTDELRAGTAVQAKATKPAS
jgi:membrane fusion protein (multidrug efflux system)